MDADRRDYNRVTIPIDLFVDGQRHRVIDWSLGGLAVMSTKRSNLRAGTLLDGFLRVTQKGVDVSLNVKLRVIYAEAGRLGLAFHNILPEQLSVLRTLILGHGLPQLGRLSPTLGEGDTAGDGGARGAAGRRRLPTRKRLNLRSPVLWGLAASVAAVAIFAFGSWPCPVHRSAAAAIAAPSVPVVNTKAGYVDRVLVTPGTSATTGQPILSVRSQAEPSETVFVESPCDCIVLSLPVKVGMELRSQQVVGSAVTSGSGAHLVGALFDRGSKPRVGEEVSIVIPASDTTASGRIAAIGGDGTAVTGLPAAVRDDPRYVFVLIEREGAVKPEDVGLPVRVDLTDARRFQGVCALWQRLSGAGAPSLAEAG
ncbi:MAG: PilZ domain-containing protein [Rhodospirillales bacterium]|jgi:hypothetical protein|nr:PilZ domain-containing protein [Rhodospirillales bacterium]